MKKNQLTTTKSTAIILGKSKSLMGITKKLLESKSKNLAEAKISQELTTREDITIISDLMWEKETQEKMKWDDAMEYAKNLRLGGYDDWRLPTPEELLEVVTLCGGIATNYNDVNWNEIMNKNLANEIYQANYKTKGFASSHYWSSTTNADGSILAWYIYIDSGYQDYFGYKAASNYVRCVRAGQ